MTATRTVAQTTSVTVFTAVGDHITRSETRHDGRVDPLKQMLDGVCDAISGEVHMRLARLTDLIASDDPLLSAVERNNEGHRLTGLHDQAQRARERVLIAVEQDLPTNEPLSDLFTIAHELMGHYMPGATP